MQSRVCKYTSLYMFVSLHVSYTKQRCSQDNNYLGCVHNLPCKTVSLLVVIFSLYVLICSDLLTVMDLAYKLHDQFRNTGDGHLFHQLLYTGPLAVRTMRQPASLLAISIAIVHGLARTHATSKETRESAVITWWSLLRVPI